MPKSKPPRKKKKSAGTRGGRSETLPPLPDRRAIEGLMAGLAPRRGGDDLLREAQAQMYEAWDAATRRERVRLARKALEISPACADAYVLLAEESAKTLDEALDLYRRGTEAGRLALGPETFKRDTGHFWGILETRPYMRARAGLAGALWQTGEREAAIDHYRAMLRLNPNDNQGVRDELATCYLEMDRDDELTKLLDRYKEDPSALWLYTRALVAYRREGDSDRSRELLAKAMQTNRHVPPLLLGAKAMPKRLGPYMTWGGEDEAAYYAIACREGWLRSSGALPWLREQSAAALPVKP